MNLRTRSFMHEVLGGLSAGIIAIALGLAAALLIPHELAESRWFVFAAFTAAVFISAGLSLGFSLHFGVVLNRFLAMLGVHILIGIPIVTFMPERMRPQTWMLILLLSVETAVVRRLADEGSK